VYLELPKSCSELHWKLQMRSMRRMKRKIPQHWMTRSLRTPKTQVPRKAEQLMN
jgi:hypothetical protein